MFVSLHVCIVCMLCYSISGAKFSGVHLQPTVGSSQFFFFFIHPSITLFTNNQIKLCSYYIQLSATLCEQLHTIVESVCSCCHIGKASVHVIITASITSQFQEPINILTGSIVYQCTDGYFCDNVVYSDISQSLTNTKLSRPEDGHFCQSH